MRKLLTLIVFFCCVHFVHSQVNAKKEYSAASVSDQKKSAQSLVVSYFNERTNAYSSNGKHINQTEANKLNQIVAQLENQYGNSYEFYYVSMVNSNFGDTFPVFLNAASSKKETQEILPYLLAYASMNNESGDVKKMAQKIYETNTVSKAQYEYAQNLLNSVGPNGYLFTYGYDDTYPLIIQQQIKGVRKDVKVINMEWLQNDVYRNSVTQKIDVKYNGKVIGDESRFIRALAAEGSKNEIYIASSVPASALREMSRQLYNTGLAFKLTDKSFDNIIVLQQNWERFKTKELKNSSSSKDNKLKTNYLFGLIQLYKHYKFTNEDKKRAYLNYINTIGKLTNKTAQIKELLND